MLTCGDTVAQALLGEEEGHGVSGETGGAEGTSSAVEPVVTAVVEVARRLLAR